MLLGERGEKKKGNLKKCVHVLGIFVNQEKIHPHSVFSLFWRENILVGQGRKYLGPTIYFPSSSPNQTHSKKIFLPIFSPKFSINPVSPLNKHTLRFNSKVVVLGVFVDYTKTNNVMKILAYFAINHDALHILK